MANVYADAITLFEGNYYELIFQSDYQLMVATNNLGLKTERIDDFTFKFSGFVAVAAREDPYYITILKASESEEGQDVNVKVYVKKYDGPYQELSS